MLKVAAPEMKVVSSGPPSPIAAFSSGQGYFDKAHQQAECGYLLFPSTS